MTVFNFGSINVDHFYNVPHLPRPGETLAATGHAQGLGGKGANQSVAARRMGSDVIHIGMVGPEGAGRRELDQFGVDVRFTGTDGRMTGHANIYVDERGENLIVVMPGANHEQSLTLLEAAMSEAQVGDVFLLQNEANHTAEAARMARDAGCFVIYSAAPFKPEKAHDLLPLVDVLVVNAVEAEQMVEFLGIEIEELEVPALLITNGADGAMWRGTTEVFQAAFTADPVDTTGAGDCFIGAVAAGLDQGLSIAEALHLGSAASAIQVTRPGTADAIPTRQEVDALLAQS